MSKVLKVDSDYEDVMCPACSHKWWALKSLGGYETIRCPECKCPLKSPQWTA